VSAKPLLEVPADSRILIDANIFIYAAGGESLQCSQFLERCVREEVRGVATLEILGEVCHRLMLAEAVASGAISRTAAAALRRNRGVITGLARYWSYIERTFNMNILMLALDESRFRRAQGIRQRHLLLTNDSLLLAAAEMYQIPALATLDSDFDHVPWIRIFRPNDL
jgi:predicted nucleic acid-binding protein